jgi:hypothetical protein
LDPSVELDNNAYVLIQVMSSGKALWTSRLKGYSGSGAATLNTASLASPVVPFYEGRQTSTTSSVTSMSLLGRIEFGLVSGNAWKARFAGVGPDGELEQQVSRVDKDAVSKKPSFGDGSKFLMNANFTGVRRLSFGQGVGCRWSDSNVTALPSLIPANVRMLLEMRDPQVDGTYLSYQWAVTASNSGILKVAGIPGTTGSMPPTLSLRLDRARGEWTGSYTVLGKRRTLMGVSVASGDYPLLRAGGWGEWTPSSKIIAGFWWLLLP